MDAFDPTSSWDDRYTRTTAGREEVRGRHLALTRPARNLLLVLDANRSAREWVAMVQGASEADFLQLLAAGLVTLTARGPSARPAIALPARPPLAPVSPVAPPAVMSMMPIMPPPSLPASGREPAHLPEAGDGRLTAPLPLPLAPHLDEPAPGASGAGAPVTLAAALSTVGYRTLYDRITAEAKPRLGLLTGYRMVLELERCAGPAEVRQLALRFVDRVREKSGPEAALALATRLAQPEPPSGG